MTKRVISSILAAGLVCGTMALVGCGDDTPPTPPAVTKPAPSTMKAMEDTTKAMTAATATMTAPAK